MLMHGRVLRLSLVNMMCTSSGSEQFFDERLSPPSKTQCHIIARKFVDIVRSCFDLPESIQLSLPSHRGVLAIPPLRYCTMLIETPMVSNRSLESRFCPTHALSGSVPGSSRQGFGGRSCTRRLSRLAFET